MKLPFKDIKLKINGIPVDTEDINLEWEYKSSLKDPLDLSSVTLERGTVEVKVNRRGLKALLKELDKKQKEVKYMIIFDNSLPVDYDIRNNLPDDYDESGLRDGMIIRMKDGKKGRVEKI